MEQKEFRELVETFLNGIANATLERKLLFEKDYDVIGYSSLGQAIIKVTGGSNSVSYWLMTGSGAMKIENPSEFKVSEPFLKQRKNYLSRLSLE